MSVAATLVSPNAFQPGLALPPSSWPRVRLQCGTLIGHSLSPAPGLPPDVVLEQACALSHSAEVPVCVAIDTDLSLLPGRAATALSRARLGSGRLELALDATALQEAGVEALLALSALQDQGVGVALSGFGPQHTSLVSRLPLSAVIFAGDLIDGVPGDAAATALLRVLIGKARQLGLRLVARGIESELQRALLSGLGCDEGEGGLFGAVPVDADDA